MVYSKKRGAIFSLGESATSRALRRYFHNMSYLIYKEMSARQVLNIDKSRLSKGEWDYFTKASFDFVVCRDDEDQTFELIVEYDGIQHNQREYYLKDNLKNKLCMMSGFPILRIGVEDVKDREGITFLEYILDIYFGEKILENDNRGKGCMQRRR